MTTPIIDLTETLDDLRDERTRYAEYVLATLQIVANRLGDAKQAAMQNCQGCTDRGRKESYLGRMNAYGNALELVGEAMRAIARRR